MNSKYRLSFNSTLGSQASEDEFKKFFSESNEIRDLVEEQRVDFFVFSSLEDEISDSFKQVRDLIDQKNSPVVGTIGNFGS